MAAELDTHVEEFRTPPLAEPSPFTVVAADALVVRGREGGRVVPVHALVATGVNADGHREILGLQVTTSEDGAGWLEFFRDLTACGLSGVKLVTSDAHAGLVAAIGATLPGAATIGSIRAHCSSVRSDGCGRGEVAGTLSNAFSASLLGHADEAVVVPRRWLFLRPAVTRAMLLGASGSDR